MCAKFLFLDTRVYSSGGFIAKHLPGGQPNRSCTNEQESMKRAHEHADGGTNGSDWEERFSRTHQKKYWFDSKSGATVWDEPKTLKKLKDSSEVASQDEQRKRIVAVQAPSSSSSSISKWTKHYSMKHAREYWYNESSQTNSWTDPSLTSPNPSSEQSNTPRLSTANVENPPAEVFSTSPRIAEVLRREEEAVAVNNKTCPRVINSVDLPALIRRLFVEPVTKQSANAGFEVIFILPNDELADITRAVQEDQILKTRLKLKRGDQVVDLPSFWDVWASNPGLSKAILNSSDPNEEKWKCRRDFGYKIATTFMPPYAKSIYEHFNAESVLDPCAGWGDRLVGAAASKCVKRYVCFDPNRALRPGYAKLMGLFGHSVEHLDEDHLHFSNKFRCHAQPFEKGALELESESFDLVFTSPPFFEYEMYNPLNPKYKDWLEEFYTPLFIQACRCVKTGGHVCIHIGDTSGGVIEPFLHNNVHLICNLKMIHRIGLKGLMSGETRTVWVFKKCAPLTVSRIRALSNPPIRTLTIGNNTMKFLVYDDGHVVGGTKQRLLGRLLLNVNATEVIYAGPDGGIAQVALAWAAKLCNKKAVIFLNTYCMGEKPPLVQLAEALGATIHFPDPNSRGRTLQDTQKDAAAYADASTDRHILPFGLRSPPGEPSFDLFREALLESLRGAPPPSRLWLVAGSGFLLDVLHSIWPETTYMVVQVGKTVWPDQLENKSAHLFKAPEGFGDRALSQPPYPTVPWYDAKLWQFAVKNWVEGDCIWNVGAVPANPVEHAKKFLQLITDSKS